jgi:hypothetical protein
LKAGGHLENGETGVIEAIEALDRILGANWSALSFKASDHNQISLALEIGAHSWIGKAV